MLVVACDPFAWKEGAEPMRITFDQLCRQPAASAAEAEAAPGKSAACAASPAVTAMSARLRNVQPLVLCVDSPGYDDWQTSKGLSASSSMAPFFGFDTTGLRAPTLHTLLFLRCMRHLRWLRLTLGGRVYGGFALSSDDVALVAAQCAASLTSLTLGIGEAGCQPSSLQQRDGVQLELCLSSLVPLREEGALPQLTELSCPASLWNRALSEAPLARRLHRLCLSGGYGDKGNVWLDTRALGQLCHLRLERWHLDGSLEAKAPELGAWSVPLREAFTSMEQLRSLELVTPHGQGGAGLSELLEALPPTLRILTLSLSLRRDVSESALPWPLAGEMVALLERCGPTLYVDVRLVDQRSHRILIVSLKNKKNKNQEMLPLPSLLEALCQQTPADPVHPRLTLLERPS
jgi:hypothetical protein